jgi:glycosyltransferase involved in cell wall biosynthesis
MGRVSVVVPTYNRRETIPRALESIHQQTYDDIETIIVDDASTDGTKELIAEQFPSVMYLRHEDNRGGSAARNTGIQAANGQYIAFLDSDDEWKPKKLTRQIDCIQTSGEQCGAVYTGLKKVRNGRTEFVRSPSATGNIHERQLSRDHVGPTSTVLVRRNCFDAVGGFREDLPARQDYEMWLRLSRDYEFDYVEDPLTVLYTDSTDRISEQTESRIEAHELLITEIREEISEFSECRQQAILGTQYYTLARYCQKNGMAPRARHYFITSLRQQPLKLRAWAGIGLTLLGVTTREPLLKKVRTLLNDHD